jgi:hypothetical protein
MKYSVSILFLFLIQCVFAQSSSIEETPYNYLGVIKLNDTAFISYKLAFEAKDGIIQGYSITDAGGPHETKSNVKGTYSKDEKELIFSEYDIVYTKSPITELDFCLVNFEGKLRNLEKSKPFSGDFKGLYPDGKSCLDGQIIMTPLAQVQKRAKKADKMIQKSKRFSEKIKKNVSASTALDTLSMSVVKTGENLNVFMKTKNVIISVYDAGKVDDDRINLYIDGVLVLEDYAIEKNKKEIPITITKEFTVIKVEALNEGTSAPNTVKVEINDGQRLISTRTSLKSKEHAAMTLVNQ